MPQIEIESPVAVSGLAKPQELDSPAPPPNSRLKVVTMAALFLILLLSTIALLFYFRPFAGSQPVSVKKSATKRVDYMGAVQSFFEAPDTQRFGTAVRLAPKWVKLSVVSAIIIVISAIAMVVVYLTFYKSGSDEIIAEPVLVKKKGSFHIGPYSADIFFILKSIAALFLFMLGIFLVIFVIKKVNSGRSEPSTNVQGANQGDRVRPGPNEADILPGAPAADSESGEGENNGKEPPPKPPASVANPEPTTPSRKPEDPEPRLSSPSSPDTDTKDVWTDEKFDETFAKKALLIKTAKFVFGPGVAKKFDTKVGTMAIMVKNQQATYTLAEINILAKRNTILRPGEYFFETDLNGEITDHGDNTYSATAKGYSEEYKNLLLKPFDPENAIAIKLRKEISNYFTQAGV